MARIWFYVKLYPFYFSKSLQSRMTYKGDFLLGVLASVLMQSLGFVFIGAVFKNIPEINGWCFDEIAFVYGMAALALGLNEFLFAGTWSVSEYVQDGSLDRLIIRPVSTMYSILASDVTLHGIGSAFFGLAICIVSVIKLDLVISVNTLLFWGISIICGAIIYFSINMICATFAFWMTNSQSIMMLIQNVAEFSKYPAAMYSKGVKFFISFLIPFAFTSCYPATVILGKESKFICFLGPILVAIIMVLFSTLFWKYALKKYQSAGG